VLLLPHEMYVQWIMRILRTALLFTLCAVLAPGGSALAQAPDPFAEDGIHDLKLFIHSSDLVELREHYAENTYYPADIDYRGVRLRNVGVRSRGSGSRSATKLGLRIDPNRYRSGQSFLGMNALVLDNLWQDASLVRERLAMAMYARAGVSAPREVFVRLFINDVYEGAYALVEEVDEQFIEASTSRGGDVLFEYKWVAAFRGEDLGRDPAAYLPLFEARTHEDAPVDTLYGPIRDIFAASSMLEGDVWRRFVEERLDLRQMLTYLAVETFVSDSDGLLGGEGMNNFYLHRPADGLQHRMVPWDKDQAFTDLGASIWLRADENVLVRRALAVPDLRAHYLDELERCAALASEDGWLAAQLERLLATIDPAARDDLRRPHLEDERQAAIAALQTFVAERATRVIDEVTRSRQ
jgi:spore coat protein H